MLVIEDLNPTRFTTGPQARKRVNKEDAIRALTIIYNKYNTVSALVQYEIKELLINISCNLIGKGGDENTKLFMKEVSLEKQYEIIKIIWNQEYELSDAVKMGSELISFVENNF